MRIISNFKDYYDSLQDFDSTVWIRNFTIIDCRFEVSLYHHPRIIPLIFGYCGTYFKYEIELNNDINSNVETIFDPNNKISHELMEPISSRLYQSNFDTLDLSIFKKENLFTKYNTPIFIIVKKSNRQYHVILNPSLRRMGFYRVKNISQTYQDLDSFICGVLSNNPSNIELPEKYRRGNRFDKYSFRRLPERRMEEKAL